MKRNMDIKFRADLTAYFYERHPPWIRSKEDHRVSVLPGVSGVLDTLVKVGQKFLIVWGPLRTCVDHH